MSYLALLAAPRAFLVAAATILITIVLIVTAGCASGTGTTSSTAPFSSTTSSIQTTSSAPTSSNTVSSTTTSATNPSGSSPSTTTAGGRTPLVGVNGETINPSDFSTTIDNKYMPLKLGAVYTYEGTSPDGPCKVVVTVSTDVETIAGVTCVVVHDQVTVGGQVTEDTFDWYAQDKAGNVWCFGGDTKELDNGKVTNTASTREAGVNGAQPGIIMEAGPKVGDTYTQEYLKGEAEDNAKVVALDGSATVPYGTFQNCIRTQESAPLKPDALEEKLYAPGIGNVKTQVVKGGSEVEVLVSVSGM